MNRRYTIDVTGWNDHNEAVSETVTVVAPDESASAAIDLGVERAKKLGVIEIGDARCSGSLLLGWAVITEDGLTMLVNLTEAEAKKTAATPTPNGTPQVAVPERVAEVALHQWKDLQTSYDRKLNEARIAATARILDGFNCSVQA